MAVLNDSPDPFHNAFFFLGTAKAQIPQHLQLAAMRFQCGMDRKVSLFPRPDDRFFSIARFSGGLFTRGGHMPVCDLPAFYRGEVADMIEKSFQVTPAYLLRVFYTQ